MTSLTCFVEKSSAVIFKGSKLITFHTTLTGATITFIITNVSLMNFYTKQKLAPDRSFAHAYY